MTTDIRVPSLPESVADATVLEWHRAPGDNVSANENLVDLETDKVVLEVPAPKDGVLREILIPAGETVTADTVLARIEPSAPTTATKSGSETAGPASAQRAPADGRGVGPVVSAGQEGAEPARDQARASEQPHVAPAARRLIKELGLDPSRIPGSGRDGRIQKTDVVAWLDQRESASPAEDPDQAAFRGPATADSQAPPADLPAMKSARPEQRVPMTRLRAKIAERLLQAQQQTASLTTFNEVDMSAVMALRGRYRDEFEQQHGVRLGFMSFFVKAVVAALQQFPVINAAIDGDEIVYRGYFDIGIAVSTDRGLVVPVLRDGDRLGLAEIEREIADFGRRARDGQLSFEELSGGTFSITNGGVFGSLLSTPIINPPQSAILGMHKIEERPIAEKGHVVIRPMMYLALSYDHRLIDGRDAVRFLVGVKQAIEDPARLLLSL